MRKLLLVIASVCALGTVAAATLPATAAAAGLSPPVADCQLHGHLTRTYTAAELRQALQTMPADVAEYSNCENVIKAALLAMVGGLSGGGSGGGGGGSFLPAWVIAVLAVLALTAAGSAAVAMRNRRRGSPG
jgi:hypothetical protein